MKKKIYNILAILIIILNIPFDLFSQDKLTTVQIENLLKNSEEKQITTNSFDDLSPKIISTNEKDKATQLLLFSSNREGNYEIYLKNLTTEKISQITNDPNDQYSPFWLNDDEFGYTTNSSDVLGDIFFSEFSIDKDKITEKNQKKISSSKGDESNCKKIDNRLYFIYRKNSLKYIDLNNGNITKEIFFTNQQKVSKNITAYDILKTDKNISKCIFLSPNEKNNSSFNNLYIADFYMNNDTLRNVTQLTYGKNIIGEIKFSNNGRYITYDSKNRDTNNDKVINFGDNSLLYLLESRNSQIKKKDEIKRDINFNFFKTYQLTLENYSSTEAIFSQNDDKIYFVSDKKGNKDIYEIDLYGSIPMFSTDKSFQIQSNVAEYLYNQYQLDKLYSKEKIQNKQSLLKSLLAYQRVLKQFQVIKIDNKNQKYINLLKNSYLKIAEIYETLEKYKKSENIYSLIQTKFKDDKKLFIFAEVRKQQVLMKRKEISIEFDGYELDVILKHLISQKKRYKNDNEEISYFISSIYYNLKRYDLANDYLTEIMEQKKDNETVVKALFLQAKISYQNKLFSPALRAIKEALSFKNSTSIIKEELIKLFYEISFESDAKKSKNILTLEQKGKIIQSIIGNENFPIELRTYGHLILAKEFLNTGIFSKIETAIEQFDRVKLTFIQNNSNKLLKLYSATADLELSEYYIKSSQFEEAEGVLKFSIKKYNDIDIRYGFYSKKSNELLTKLYLNKANDKLNTNNISSALLNFLEVVELDENNIDGYRGVVICYNRENKIDYAINYLLEKLKNDENNSNLNYALGYAYSFKGSNIKTSKNIGRYDLATINTSNNYLKRALELDSKIRYIVKT